MEFTSINEMFKWRVERSGPQTALTYKNTQTGNWVKVSWNRYYETVRFIARGLHALGLEKGERIALFSDNRVEWLFCDLGALGCGGVVVPIYHTSPKGDVEYIVTHSDAKFLIVENLTLLDRVLQVREKLTALEKIILIEGPAPDEDDGVTTLSQVVEQGRQAEPGLYKSLSEQVGLDDLATIVYTSTGGPLMGVVHAHAQILAQQYALQQMVQLREDQTTLHFLPLSHIFGRTVQYLNLFTGITLALAESYDRLMMNLQETNPDMMAAVPRVFQKIYSGVLNEVALSGGMQRTTLNWCLDVGRQVSRLKDQRQPIPLVLNGKYQAARKLFFDRFRQKFGDRIKFLVSSGAPLQKEVASFFHATGLTVLEAYGMTEVAGAATINTVTDNKIGSVGKPIHGVEIELAGDGEIRLKGPVVMREYWKSPDSTASVLQDDWLSTGDIGEIDEDGFLRITDRKKDIIITSGGKNISPQNIENHLKADPFIDRVYVHGDQRNFTSALITLNRQNLTQWAKEKNIPHTDFAELTQREEVRRLIEEAIQRKNQDLSGPESIKKFAILPGRFSVDGGELTSSEKLRRRTIDQKYSDILDGFYE